VKTTAPPDPHARTPKFKPPPQRRILVENPAKLYGF
jgi:hypothetical protein